jgi:hypothetical protein
MRTALNVNLEFIETQECKNWDISFFFGYEENVGFGIVCIYVDFLSLITFRWNLYSLIGDFDCCLRKINE